MKAKPNTVYHITGDVHYMAIALGKQAILTIHDVGSVTGKGGWMKRWYLKMFWFYLPAIRVKNITVISEFTKQELSKIIPSYTHKIRVIYNPVNPVFKWTEKTFNTQEPLILLMGTKPNKNLERTLEALSGFKCRLLIVGELTPPQRKLLETLQYNYSNQVHLSLAAVYTCYQACDLLCFASLYEGFGMPIIEAQAVGRPVITANIGAMKEVAGGAAIAVNPYDAYEIRVAVEQLVVNQTYREQLVTKGFKNTERFSMAAVSNSYLELYKGF